MFYQGYVPASQTQKMTFWESIHQDLQLLYVPKCPGSRKQKGFSVYHSAHNTNVLHTSMSKFCKLVRLLRLYKSIHEVIFWENGGLTESLWSKEEPPSFRVLIGIMYPITITA